MDVATGFVVLHDTLTPHVLAFAAIVHTDGDTVSVPDAGGRVGATERSTKLTSRDESPPNRFSPV
jgi:hypothetical protein